MHSQQQQQEFYAAHQSALPLSRLAVHPSGKPKRPPNAFLVFSSVRRRELQKIYPELKTAALSKRLGDEWRGMNNERKELYASRAKDIKDNFQTTFPEYVYTRRSSKKRPHGDMDAGSSKKFKGGEYDENGTYGQLDPNRPRRPMNSYLIFNQEMRHKLLLENANMTVSEISQSIGSRWATMSTEMKREYTEKAAEIKASFLKKHPDYVYSRRSKAEIAACGAARRRPNTNANDSSNDGSSSGNNGNGNAGSSKDGGRGGSGSMNSQGMGSNSGNNARSGGNGSNNNNGNNGIDDHGDRDNTANDMTINGKNAKARGKKKTKDPDAPKHPIPGFLFFRSGERAKIRQMNPNESIPAVAAKMWNGMSQEEKEPWLQMAQQDKLRYAEEMQAYSAKKGRSAKSGRS
ncbi:hypothetical protein BGW38_002357 [Lunasporangiospora selenospora]|uniref:HMG box domain-containing protein n=1 Tax=Lunasporangiospora selenospora TaxID=979761 RepID=A0A9P6KDH7_9FUNG|nr:hypothetical protein BGW38_002357 [Lunasporangiospora selenospora]